MQELKVAVLSQNHRRSQGGDPGGPESINRNASNNKNLTKNLLSSFSVFFLGSLRTTVVLITINNIDKQGARRTPLIQF